MKKIFLTIICLLLLVACTVDNPANCNETIDVDNDNNVEYVEIKSYFNNYQYRKIVVEGHDYYFRGWHTRGGHGSDLVHNPNCRACNGE